MVYCSLLDALNSLQVCDAVNSRRSLGGNIFFQLHYQVEHLVTKVNCRRFPVDWPFIRKTKQKAQSHSSLFVQSDAEMID